MIIPILMPYSYKVYNNSPRATFLSALSSRLFIPSMLWVPAGIYFSSRESNYIFGIASTLVFVLIVLTKMVFAPYIAKKDLEKLILMEPKEVFLSNPFLIKRILTINPGFAPTYQEIISNNKYCVNCQVWVKNFSHCHCSEPRFCKFSALNLDGNF